MTEKKWTVEEIKELILTRDDAVVRGLKRIYDYQVADEKRDEATKYHNNVGFKPQDAKFATSLVQGWILNNRQISEKQMYRARKLMLKYSGQLLRIIYEKQ